MNDNIFKTFFFHYIIFDLKGHIRSNKALYVYLFSYKNSCVKPTLPQIACALLSAIPTKRERDSSLFCSLDVETRNDVQSFDQIITLTYVLMDNFCPCFYVYLKSEIPLFVNSQHAHTNVYIVPNTILK